VLVFPPALLFAIDVGMIVTGYGSNFCAWNLERLSEKKKTEDLLFI
jgi:hypothetical protein